MLREEIRRDKRMINLEQMGERQKSGRLYMYKGPRCVKKSLWMLKVHGVYKERDASGTSASPARGVQFCRYCWVANMSGYKNGKKIGQPARGKHMVRAHSRYSLTFSQPERSQNKA